MGVTMKSLLVLVVAGLSQGAEWRTSGSKHCIERCHVGTRRELDSVLWCKAVDGVSKEHKPSESGRPSAHEDDDVAEEDRYLWDYCTPATVNAIEGGEIFDEGVEAVVLPEGIDRRKRQTGASGGHFPDTVGQQRSSSLAGINCEGECKENFGELELSLGECGPNSKSVWTTVGIVIGCIVAALLLIGLIAYMVSRRKYSQAASNDY